MGTISKLLITAAVAGTAVVAVLVVRVEVETPPAPAAQVEAPPAAPARSLPPVGGQSPPVQFRAPRM